METKSAELKSAPAQIERLAFNARETCEMLGGISLVTLWRLEKSGHLHRVPGIPRRTFARREIERFLSGKPVEIAA